MKVLNLSKNLKKLLISSAALLMFASVGASTGTVNVNARHVRTHRSMRMHHHIRKHAKRRIKKHSRKSLHAYNVKRYNHKHNVHKLNARKYTRRHHQTKKVLLGENSQSNINQGYYKTGHKDGLNFANDWLGTAKNGDIDMIQHLSGNNFYHKGWTNAVYPYAGSHKSTEAMYNALNNPSLGLYQSSKQFIRE